LFCFFVSLLFSLYHCLSFYSEIVFFLSFWLACFLVSCFPAFTMKDVIIAQSKGGVGKSTLLCLLAMALNDSEVPVAVLDLDPQGTTHSWLSDHLADLPNIEILPDPRAKPQRAAAVRLIDTEGRSSFEQTIDALPHAALYLIPATPSLEDVRIAGKTATLLKRHRPTANLRLLWNKIREGHDDCTPATLATYGKQIAIPVLKNMVHESKPYRDARFPPPRGGWSRATTSKHANELRKLTHEVLAALVA
jgi:chromosome partitioning protein